ncbi:hypothetical protein [Halovalidus salilacus]|uniref:hypothetical protein n=1 Tax=Halovalidus salilacus TaxID=3075124 RepID=UPI00387DC45B
MAASGSVCPLDRDERDIVNTSALVVPVRVVEVLERQIGSAQGDPLSLLGLGDPRLAIEGRISKFDLEVVRPQPHLVELVCVLGFVEFIEEVEPSDRGSVAGFGRDVLRVRRHDVGFRIIAFVTERVPVAAERAFHPVVRVLERA